MQRAKARDLQVVSLKRKIKLGQKDFAEDFEVHKGKNNGLRNQNRVQLVTLLNAP